LGWPANCLILGAEKYCAEKGSEPRHGGRLT
jgi:hypothetical protein